MTLFSAPEYASYVALCRELRLEREFEEGDWFLDTEQGPAFPGLICSERRQVGDRLVTFWTATKTGRTTIWLPRLDQWLAMLEEAGATSLYWHRLPSNGWYRVYLDPEVRNAGPHGPQPDADLMSGGPTREEAAARLWKVLAERKVASG